MSRRTLLLISTAFFAAAVVCIALYLKMDKMTYLYVALGSTLIGSLMSHISKSKTH